MMDENPQTMPPPQYPDGSRVLCADGQTLGEVVATYREYLIVERGYFFPTNFFVPYAAIAEAGGGDIVLSLNGRDALAQGWHTPPLDPVVPEAPPEPVPATQPPAAIPATTAAPNVVADPVALVRDEAAPEAQALPAAPEPEPVVEAGEPETAPVEAESVRAVEVSGPESPPQEEAEARAEPTSTAAPTVPAEEVVEVQSFQPDASVPPAEPGEIGTVNLAPSFVGIPGRRLTDAELWSLLEPKDSPEESEEQSEDAEVENDPPDKSGS